jgi:hypothetical protein
LKPRSGTGLRPDLAWRPDLRTEAGGGWRDKSLGVWRLAEIAGETPR